jgi:amino acid transporter
MLSRIRNKLIGSPLPTHFLGAERLNKVRALAAFSPDALSSIAYANQEIYLGLVVAGAYGLSMSTRIGFAVSVLLVIVGVSYYQIIHAYPSGGGSYAVAKDNLGANPGLAAGAALLVGYLLTSAVSLTAGVEAIASAFPILWNYRIALALLFLLVLTLVNLRGTRESGTLLALPVYSFLGFYLLMLAYGFFLALHQGPGDLIKSSPPALQPLSISIFLHVYATGCTALTGIEAISNGVPVFKVPESKNAGKTLLVLIILMVILFLGSISLTQYFAVVSGPEETILSALTHRILGNNLGYYIIQITTMLILAVAANTSFAGFPRLAAVIAEDGYLPRQLKNLGDRLVFNNGILLLSIACGLLIVIFGGDSHRLIPLFAVGVFLAFSLSQIGMVLHWLRTREQGWQLKALINTLGAAATTLSFCVILFSKFLEGAWISVLLIAVLIYFFKQVYGHYQEIRQDLSSSKFVSSRKDSAQLRLVIPISGVHIGTLTAVDQARSISENLTAVYVELEPETGEGVEEKWKRWFPDIPLVIVPSPYRSMIGPLFDCLDELDAKAGDGQQAAVVLPEFVPAKPWHAMLHNQSAFLIREALFHRRRTCGFQRMIIDIPIHLTK